MILYGYDKPLAEWTAKRLGMIALAEPLSAIGVVQHNQITAAAVFNNYRPPNIEVTFVSSTPRWASRDAIRQILAYPFLQLGCRRITAICEAHNAQVREFMTRLGFKLEGFHPEALPTGDAMTWGLMRYDAERWISDGKVKSASPRHS